MIHRGKAQEETGDGIGERPLPVVVNHTQDAVKDGENDAAV